MERVLANKANYLSRLGHELIIVTTDQQGRKPFFEIDPRIVQIDLAINYTKADDGLLRKSAAYIIKQRRHKKTLTTCLLRLKANVVISMFDHDATLLFKIKDGSKKVLEIHFSRFKRLQYGRTGLWAWVDRFRTRQDLSLAKRYDRFVVLTKEDAGYWGKLPNMRIIPNANTFEPAQSANLCSKRVIAVGRFDDQKAFDELIMAWTAVRKQHPDWVLSIFGGGPGKSALQALINHLDLQDVVQLCAAVQDIEREYLNSSMLAMTSRYEGLPMALLEAQACGLPLLAYACKCGPRDIIQDCINGYLIPEGDQAGLAAKLINLMDDAGLRTKMGLASQRLSANFKEEVVMQHWLQLFKQKTIVISAVNLNIGGTLTILRDCLSHLSQLASAGEYEVMALVYKAELASFPNIKYLETQWPKKRWVNRLWYEYVSMKKLSKDIGHVYLWLSLHDTTPNVFAEKRAVYCHNPFPFYSWKWQECLVAPRIVLFALFSKFIYKKNIKENDYVIVQQQWLKHAIRHLFKLPDQKIVLALPQTQENLKATSVAAKKTKTYSFIYAASPNSHKNFECICKAAALLEQEPEMAFKVYMTLSGKENRYAGWLYKNWGSGSRSLKFLGFQDRQSLYALYEEADCMIFPSKVETWGLPISEFAAFQKPMLLADLPYAHETAAGTNQLAFFNPDHAAVLAAQMKAMIQGDHSILHTAPIQPIEVPVAKSWAELFNILLKS
jgi:glycosyltransferase involved in cell wall biosynthesis